MNLLVYFSEYSNGYKTFLLTFMDLLFVKEGFYVNFGVFRTYMRLYKIPVLITKFWAIYLFP